MQQYVFVFYLDVVPSRLLHSPAYIDYNAGLLVFQSRWSSLNLVDDHACTWFVLLAVL